MIKDSTNKKAFTMLELVFVIVILGIVASIGSSIIVQVYESYIMQRAVHRASIKTELAVNQLANRLTYRIDQTVIGRALGATGSVINTHIMKSSRIDTQARANTFRIFEWIPYDNDGRSATQVPGWSGFADLDHANTDFDNIVSTGSALATEDTVLGNLFPGMGRPAIMFMGNNNIYRTAAGTEYRIDCIYQNNGCFFPVTAPLAGDQLALNGDIVDGDMSYTEFYRLAGSAYAVVPSNVGPGPNGANLTDNGTAVWDLTLHSDYQPWDGENYTQAASQSLLLRNVSVFRFKQERNSLRIKICSVETIGNSDISICKEKAVIR